MPVSRPSHLLAMSASAVLGSALLLTAVSPGQVFAAGAVTSYFMSLTPIAPTASLAPNATAVITVFADDATGAPVPGAVVHMSISQTIGGGSASVGGTVLGSVPIAFTAATGKISVTYKAPAVLPMGGRDIIKVANAHSGATVSASDSYSFATVDRYVFGGSPIAAPGTLAAGSTNLVAVWPYHGASIAPAGTIVYLSFSAVQGGGTASVGATTLTTTPTPFATGASGQVVVSYRLPAVPPPTGTDILTASDATKNPTITRTDAYSFAGPASYVFSPNPIAAPGTGGIQNTIILQLRALDAVGHPVAGAVVWLYFTSTAPSCGVSSVGSRYLTETPERFLSNSAGTLSISYTTPCLTPLTGVETVHAQNLRVAPTVVASDAYQF